MTQTHRPPTRPQNAVRTPCQPLIVAPQSVARPHAERVSVADCPVARPCSDKTRSKQGDKRRGSGPRIIKVGGNGDMASMLQDNNAAQDLYAQDDSDDDNYYGGNNGGTSPRGAPSKQSVARAPSPRQAVRGS